MSGSGITNWPASLALNFSAKPNARKHTHTSPNCQYINTGKAQIPLHRLPQNFPATCVTGKFRGSRRLVTGKLRGSLALTLHCHDSNMNAKRRLAWLPFLRFYCHFYCILVSFDSFLFHLVRSDLWTTLQLSFSNLLCWAQTYRLKFTARAPEHPSSQPSLRSFTVSGTCVRRIMLHRVCWS